MAVECGGPGNKSSDGETNQISLATSFCIPVFCSLNNPYNCVCGAEEFVIESRKRVRKMGKKDSFPIARAVRRGSQLQYPLPRSALCSPSIRLLSDLPVNAPSSFYGKRKEPLQTPLLLFIVRTLQCLNVCVCAST